MQVTQEDCETLHFSTAATHDAPASPQQMVAYTGDSEDEQASLPDTADTPLLSSPQVCSQHYLIGHEACSGLQQSCTKSESKLRHCEGLPPAGKCASLLLQGIHGMA